MAKAKRFEVLHAFAGELNGKRTWFTRRNQDDLADMDAGERDKLVENGRIREYEEDEGADDGLGEPLDGSMATARKNRQARAVSVPMELQDGQGEDEAGGPVRRAGRRKKAAKSE
jgi:hypothetical protein